ncbi:Imm1 family immunity protein [Kribbella sp. NBC_01505]|uniref:Imm1 family immunity protein n=1 Tax=Kribbella sp. NBC_01505 TaxID=2903580 RepID=UPI00386C7A9C
MNEFVKANYQFGDADVRETVESHGQLDALVDRAAAHGRPIWLELVIRGESDAPFASTVMWIGLGASFSSLVFHEPGNDGERYDSAGTLDHPQDAEFDYGTVPTSMSSGSAIEVEPAREAAREFLATGRRPTCVSWRVFEIPINGEPEPIEGWDAFADPS